MERYKILYIGERVSVCGHEAPSSTYLYGAVASVAAASFCLETTIPALLRWKQFWNNPGGDPVEAPRL